LALVQLNIRGDAATLGEVLEQNGEINFMLEVSTSHCTRKFWYIDAICNKELVSNSLLAPFLSEFFFRRNQAVDVAIFRLRHLWFLHESRSIDGNHKIDHVPSSEFVSCFLGLYSILRMKRELVCGTDFTSCTNEKDIQ
jgi:hypothetical protein